MYFKLPTVLLFAIFLAFISCKKDSNLLTVATKSVVDVDLTTASSGGEIHSIANIVLEDYGICWSSKPDPTINNHHTAAKNGSKNFASKLTNLLANTTYYVRAFAVTNGSITYGNQVSFTTRENVQFNQSLKYGTMSDIDGNIYETIKIGSQVWMAENLKVTHYRNGNEIPNVIEQISWNNLATGALSFYKGDGNDIIGALYNWYAVKDARMLAPLGWHIPSDEEWKTLIGYLGGETLSGSKLKESGPAHWGGDIYSTNESGFTALPGGIRDHSGFNFMNANAFFWTSTSAGPGAWYRSLGNKWLDISRGNGTERLGLSVRCLKD